MTRPHAAVLWFTGLSGAGKSTIADQVYEDLKREGVAVERLDGDAVREVFPQTGFTRVERIQHIKRIGFLASLLERNGVFVVASFISPHQESREFVRGLCRNFTEIYVSTTLEECEKRDVKGLYARARRGEIAHFTGISDPYEPPVNPELELDTEKLSLREASDQVVELVKREYRSFFPSRKAG